MTNTPQTGDSRELVQFCYEGRPVRTVMIEGEPWWVAKDVCDVLGIENARRSASHLDEDERRTVPFSQVSASEPSSYGHGAQSYIVINEPGLYSLILRSRKPEAKQFKRWITHEVLPQIRKTGAYVSPGSTTNELSNLMQQAEVLSALKGVAPRDWLQEGGRNIIKQMFGDGFAPDPPTPSPRSMAAAPAIASPDASLTVGEYLASRGLGEQAIVINRGHFGQKLKRLYRETYKRDPETKNFKRDGKVVPYPAYTEKHRFLFDKVFADLRLDA